MGNKTKDRSEAKAALEAADAAVDEAIEADEAAGSTIKTRKTVDAAIAALEAAESAFVADEAESKFNFLPLVRRYVAGPFDKPALAALLSDIHSLIGTDFGQSDNLQVSVRKLGLKHGYPAALETIVSDVRSLVRATDCNPVGDDRIDTPRQAARVGAVCAANGLIDALANGWVPSAKSAATAFAVGTTVTATAAGLGAGLEAGSTWTVDPPTATTPKGCVRLAGERHAIPSAWVRPA